MPLTTKPDSVIEAINVAKSRGEERFSWMHSSRPNSDLPEDLVDEIKALKFGLVRGGMELQTYPPIVTYCVFWSDTGRPQNELQTWCDILLLEIEHIQNE